MDCLDGGFFAIIPMRRSEKNNSKREQRDDEFPVLTLSRYGFKRAILHRAPRTAIEYAFQHGVSIEECAAALFRTAGDVRREYIAIAAYYKAIDNDIRRVTVLAVIGECHTGRASGFYDDIQPSGVSIDGYQQMYRERTDLHEIAARHECPPHGFSAGSMREAG